MDAAVDAPMTADEARALTDEIKRDAKALWDKVIEAYRGRADAALGYSSWDQYCAVEFSSSKLRLPREEREAVVRSLRESGLSIRAIASAVGIDKNTVQTDLQVSEFHTPEAEIDEDALAEELIAAEPSRPSFAGVRVEPYRPVQLKVTTATTGLDGKQYARNVEPTRPRLVTLADRFEREMDALHHSIDRLSGLVAEASDAERAELASRWADVMIDRAARLSAIYRRVHD
jgi:hypothetical protein